MKRYLALLLPLVVCLHGCGQEPDPQEEEAVKAIKAFRGEITRDEKLPRRPVVEVRLDGAHIMDHSLKELKGLKGLQRLDVGCPDVTDAGHNELRQALPNTVIRP